MDISLTNLVLTLAAGVTSVASPCVLPVVPIIVTGSSEDHRLRPLLIVLGLSFSFILMGVVTTLFSSLIADRILYIEKAVGIIIIVFGLLMIFNINLFKNLTIFNRFQSRSGGKWSGLILGVSLGIIWIPCIGPLLSGVLGMVASQNDLTNGLLLMVIYSLGFSIPMLIAGYGSHYFRNRVSIIQKHAVLVRLVSGGILIVFGVYIFKQGLLSFGF